MKRFTLARDGLCFYRKMSPNLAEGTWFILDLDPVDRRGYFLAGWVRRGSLARVVQGGLCREACKHLTQPQLTYRRGMGYHRTKCGLWCELDDIENFWKTLEIGGDHPCSQKNDIDFEISISKVREMRCLAKGVSSLVLSEDTGMTLTFAPKVTATKG
ncbi:hypothetical protein M9H77_09720 [Catharanthus roseus]|uniref:Uncharacterized protein n=1 Tax=Catharanthus roseus TaxID=4058 RepID=A0ACC0C1F4_CATRO|nr:hypothetical protein M9H77_09720 [Catharanthus roseus]